MDDKLHANLSTVARQALLMERIATGLANQAHALPDGSTLESAWDELPTRYKRFVATEVNATVEDA